MRLSKINYFRGEEMNNNLKLIKHKLNAAMILIEEMQNLLEDFPQVETSHLSEALDNLEQQYYEIEDIQD